MAAIEYRISIKNGVQELSLESKTVMVPRGLFKQTVSMANNKLFFIGMQNLFYTFTLLQAQGRFYFPIFFKKFSWIF